VIHANAVNAASYGINLPLINSTAVSLSLSFRRVTEKRN